MRELLLGGRHHIHWFGLLLGWFAVLMGWFGLLLGVASCENSEQSSVDFAFEDAQGASCGVADTMLPIDGLDSDSVFHGYVGFRARE